MKYFNQTEYARHIGVSQQRISQLLKGGFLNGALKNFGSRKLIDPVKADQLLKENLDQTKRKVLPPGKPTQAQKEAFAWAIKGDNSTRESIWETLRYLVKLQDLDPGAIQIGLPGQGENGIIFNSVEVDGDTLLPQTLCICSILEAKELESWNRDYGLPEWSFGMHQEIEERLK